MAKRELIDRNDLESTTITTDDYSDNEVLDVVLMEDIEEAPVITEQEIVKPYLEKLKEQDKPMVQIDLYSVIKQKYIEREVLDKIRAEINKLTVYYTTKDKGINLISQNAVNRIFDKYKTESEG